MSSADDNVENTDLTSATVNTVTGPEEPESDQLSGAADSCISDPSERCAQTEVESSVPSCRAEGELDVSTDAQQAEEPTTDDGSSQPPDKSANDQAMDAKELEPDSGSLLQAEQSNTVDQNSPAMLDTTPKMRGGRSYQESRRSKKPGTDKTRSGVVGAKYERSSNDDRDAGKSVVPVTDVYEQCGKGDVQDRGETSATSLQNKTNDILRHKKAAVCRPTCDGDPPALVNVIVDGHEPQEMKRG